LVHLAALALVVGWIDNETVTATTAAGVEIEGAVTVVVTVAATVVVIVVVTVVVIVVVTEVTTETAVVVGVVTDETAAETVVERVAATIGETTEGMTEGTTDATTDEIARIAAVPDVGMTDEMTVIAVIAGRSDVFVNLQKRSLLCQRSRGCNHQRRVTGARRLKVLQAWLQRKPCKPAQIEYARNFRPTCRPT